MTANDFASDVSGERVDEHHPAACGGGGTLLVDVRGRRRARATT
jgi:hypothetical protein